MKKMRGGLSQILIFTFLVPIIVVFIASFTLSTLHIWSRTNLNQITQEHVNEISTIGTVTSSLNMEYKNHIEKYKPILKSYKIQYIVSQYSDDKKGFQEVYHAENAIDESAFDNLDKSIPTKVTVILEQTTISTFQKFQNRLTGNNNPSYIYVLKSVMIK